VLKQKECWAPYLGVLLKDLITIEEGGKPLKLKVRVEESDKEDKDEDQAEDGPEGDDDAEVMVQIHGGGEEDGKAKEVVYVLFDKCREMSRTASEVLACCHNYPIYPIAGAGGLLAAPGHDEENRQANLLGVGSRERRKAMAYDRLLPDEALQLQLLDAILGAMTVEELDARSLEILPRKVRP